MIVNVRFIAGDKHSFSNWSKGTTVLIAKQEIKELKSLEKIEQIKLIFSGRILQDHQTLEDVGITDNCTFHCVIRDISQVQTPAPPNTSTLPTQNTPEIEQPPTQININNTTTLQNLFGHNLDLSGTIVNLSNQDLDISGDNLNVELGSIQQFIQTLQQFRDNSGNIENIGNIQDLSSNIQQFTFTFPITTYTTTEDGVAPGEEPVEDGPVEEETTGLGTTGLANLINNLLQGNDLSGGGVLNLFQNAQNQIQTQIQTQIHTQLQSVEEQSQYITTENINSLVAMGFPDNYQLRIALQIAEGNLDVAVEYLLQNV